MEGSQKTCGRGFIAFSSKGSRSPGLSNGNLKVVESTLTSIGDILLYSHIGEEGLPQSCLVRASWRTGSDLTWPGWTIICWMMLLTRQILRKADLFGYGRFRIQLLFDTQFLNLNGNTINF